MLTVEGERAEILYNLLNRMKATMGEWVAVVVTHWLERNGAGCPDVPLLQEKLRDDAQAWAGCAHQAELEAYLSAALGEMEKTVLTEKSAKRLAALSFKSLSPDRRAAFIEWAGKQ